MGQSFKGRRDSGGTPNGLEITGAISPVGGGGEEGGRGGEEGGSGGRTCVILILFGNVVSSLQSLQLYHHGPLRELVAFFIALHLRRTHHWLLNPAFSLATSLCSTLASSVIDEMQKSPIEKRKRNLKTISPHSRGEREIWNPFINFEKRKRNPNSFPSYREEKEKSLIFLLSFERRKRNLNSFSQFREEKEKS